MTATEVLRRLLDERGVEWGESDTYRLLVTSWNDVSGHSWAFMEHRDGSFSKLTAYHITPERAIAATLGTGTCHITDNGPWGYPYVCSACGASFDPDVNNGEFNYCPNCGKRVVEPTTNDVDVEVDA